MSGVPPRIIVQRVATEIQPELSNPRREQKEAFAIAMYFQKPKRVKWTGRAFSKDESRGFVVLTPLPKFDVRLMSSLKQRT